jgi:HAD superfamily hydrolase (TIGR01509 family)
MWRESRDKSLLPDAVATLRELARRGYALAIISNTTSSVEVPALLEANGIQDLFTTVILSTVFGRRKPHASLFLAAARALGLPPQRCAYIGDNLSRDLIGARQAGFGEVVIINVQGYQQSAYDPDDDLQNDPITEMKPDARIGRLTSLLELYPERAALPAPDGDLRQPDALYEAALSTMWGVDQPIPFADTFKAGRQLGFARFELNHKVSPERYAAWDHDAYYVSTVHDPCPAVIAYEDAKQGDWMISSLDEPRRVASVDSIKRTLDLACRLGAKSVVVHPGSIQCDRSREARLRELYEQGLRGTPEYKALAAELRAHRAQFAPAHVEQVLKSLSEVIAFAKGSGVAVGLENRYRYYHLPLPDEMQLFLDLCRESWYGFQYDVGHAHTLDALGLVEHRAWLERFGERMVGAHLHDVKGILDHQAPGTGDVDFRWIAPYLPAEAFKTLEVGPQASLAELAAGLEVLAASGCIRKL